MDIGRDCRTCEYFADSLYEAFYCEAREEKLDFWEGNCKDYKISKDRAIKRIRRRIRSLEKVTQRPDVIEAQKEIDALRLAVEIMEGKA